MILYCATRACVCVCVAQSPNRMAMAHIHTLTKTYINGLRALLLLYIIIIIIVHYTYDNIVRVFSIYIKLFANATIIWIELCCMSSGRGQLKIGCLTTPSTCRKLICFFFALCYGLYPWAWEFIFLPYSMSRSASNTPKRVRPVPAAHFDWPLIIFRLFKGNLVKKKIFQQRLRPVLIAETILCIVNAINKKSLLSVFKYIARGVRSIDLYYD